MCDKITLIFSKIPRLSVHLFIIYLFLSILLSFYLASEYIFIKNFTYSVEITWQSDLVYKILFLVWFEIYFMAPAYLP